MSEHETPTKQPSEPLVTSVPAAGKKYYNIGRSASYEAARRKEIPTIRIGRKLVVPVVAIERKLSEAGGMTTTPNWASIRELVREIVIDLHFRRNVEQLHALGPRPIGEFLAELCAEHMIRRAIDTKLNRYASLSPVVVKALG